MAKVKTCVGDDSTDVNTKGRKKHLDNFGIFYAAEALLLVMAFSGAKYVFFFSLSLSPSVYFHPFLF